MALRNGIVTLTTDFGTRDGYVGAMKGVICRILPSARLVDLSHEIPPQDVRDAAQLLAAACPWFPPGTVHLAVIDPGVGGARRALAVEAGGQCYVGPDNGLLTHALRLPDAQAHEINARGYLLPERSDTFHGRDVFAPAAGHLAAGLDLARLGPVASGCSTLDLPRPARAGDRIAGEVVRIDRFGNAISNIPRAQLAELGEGAYEVWANGASFGLLRRRYEEAAPGEALALTGGDGRIEIAVNRGSAAERFGLACGLRVEVRRSARAGREGT